MEKKDKKTKKTSNVKASKKQVKNIKVKDEIKVPEEEIIIKKITEKKEKKIKVNRKDIVIAVVFLIFGMIISLLIFKRAPRLKDGNQIAISIDKYSVSEQAIYNDIRTANGLNSALRKIDLNIAKTYFNNSLDEEAKNNAQEQAETYIKQYVNYGYDEASFLAYYGFTTKDAFINYLTEDYILNKFFEEKVKSSITEDDVNSYYEKYGTGKKTVYIFSEKDSTDNLTKIRNSLKKGTAVDKVASKYEKNTAVTINSKVEVDYSSISSYSDSVAEYIKKTNASSYSKIFTDDTLGNVFVYVVSSEDAPALDTIKENVISVLVDKKKTEDSELYYKVFIDARNDKHIKFYDDAYKKQYDEYLKSHSEKKSK